MKNSMIGSHVIEHVFEVITGFRLEQSHSIGSLDKAFTCKCRELLRQVSQNPKAGLMPFLEEKLVRHQEKNIRNKHKPLPTVRKNHPPSVL